MAEEYPLYISLRGFSCSVIVRNVIAFLFYSYMEISRQCNKIFESVLFDGQAVLSLQLTVQEHSKIISIDVCTIF